ncbi:MAG: hypothetical protein DRH26_00725 [Deltaproteobacteria bacterium]|nr:MAG: hypothetical protein DRH26_00725 [Deltaproteobacteria bacterium]
MSEPIVSEVEAQINSYLTHPRTTGLAKTTRDLYKTILVNQLLPFCQLHSIPKLTPDLVDLMEDYVDFLRSNDLSAKTAQNYITVTKFFMRFLKMPLEFTYRIPRLDKQAWDLKHQRRWFSDRDIAMCKTHRFDRDHNRNHLLICLFCETGARVGEIEHIKRGDVNIEQNQILLRHSKTIPRTVFFSGETSIYLEKFLKDKFPDPTTDSFKRLFPGKNQLYKITNRMLAELGLKKKGDGRGPHTFRHFVATDLHYNKNMELTHVAALLGDTPETISSRYLHPTAQMLQSKIKKASGWS